jgi:hypothetical protein
MRATIRLVLTTLSRRVAGRLSIGACLFLRVFMPVTFCLRIHPAVERMLLPTSYNAPTSSL